MRPDEIYAESRTRLAVFVAGLDDAQLAGAVGGCPGWTVRDVVAHLAGVAADVEAGRLDGAGSPEWTGRQVAERGEMSAGDNLAEWAKHAPAVEAFVADRSGIVPFVVDVVTHEADIREALDAPAVVDTVGFDFALQGYVMALDRRLRRSGLDALRLRAGDEEWEVGVGEPAATVSTTPYEVFRALAGRRSEAQVRAYQWEGDPSPYLPVLSAFGPLPPDVSST